MPMNYVRTLFKRNNLLGKTLFNELPIFNDLDFFNRIDSLWDNMIEEIQTGFGIDQEYSEGNYKLNVDVPGFKKENLKISLENNILTITGQNKDKTRTVKKVFNIPQYIELPDAKLEDGILTVSFKIQEKSIKLIEIK
jgi:HSP20 family molecular chaperone IbpA